MLKQAFFGGIAAGMMVGIGGAVFTACDKYVGAVLFSVALLTICYLGMYLFTGKVGGLGENPSLDLLKCLGVGLVGNYVGATLTGLLLSVASPVLYKTAVVNAEKRLDKELWAALVLGVMCGILMYIAVRIYRSHSTPVGILFCVPTFILAGFEHSIADMFYLALAREFSPRSFAFLGMVVIGNTLGGVLIPLLEKAGKPTQKKNAEEAK